LYNVTSAKAEPIRITLRVNGRPMQMEVDTGAAVAVMGEALYKKIQMGLQPLTLTETATKLKIYTGEPLKVLGTTGKQLLRLPLTIVEGSGLGLVGRNWLREIKLDWIKVTKVDTEIQRLKRDRIIRLVDFRVGL